MDNLDPIVEILKKRLEHFWTLKRLGKNAIEDYAKGIAQAIREAEWTTIVNGDESTLPEKPGKYLVEFIGPSGNLNKAVKKYDSYFMTDKPQWQGLPSYSHRVTRWRQI